MKLLWIFSILIATLIDTTTLAPISDGKPPEFKHKCLSGSILCLQKPQSFGDGIDPESDDQRESDPASLPPSSSPPPPPPPASQQLLSGAPIKRQCLSGTPTNNCINHVNNDENLLDDMVNDPHNPGR